MSHKKLNWSPENLFLSATYALCRPLAPSSVAIFAQVLRRCSRSLEVCYSNHFLLPVEPFFFTTPTLFYAIPTSPIFLPGPIFYPLTHLFHHLSSLPLSWSLKGLSRSLSILFLRSSGLPFIHSASELAALCTATWYPSQYSWLISAQA